MKRPISTKLSDLFEKKVIVENGGIEKNDEHVVTEENGVRIHTNSIEN